MFAPVLAKRKTFRGHEKGRDMVQLTLKMLQTKYQFNPAYKFEKSLMQIVRRKDPANMNI